MTGAGAPRCFQTCVVIFDVKRVVLTAERLGLTEQAMDEYIYIYILIL